jgi:hypothetical protein
MGTCVTEELDVDALLNSYGKAPVSPDKRRKAVGSPWVLRKYRQHRQRALAACDTPDSIRERKLVEEAAEDLAVREVLSDIADRW